MLIPKYLLIVFCLKAEKYKEELGGFCDRSWHIQKIIIEILSINWCVSCVNFLHLDIARRIYFEASEAEVICHSFKLGSV